MKESVNNEISNLFQELIVSKIKYAIDELGNRIADIENANSEIEESIGKLPKQSGIKKIVGDDKNEIITHIDGCFGRVNTEKYLKDIVAYLKEQFGFSENQVLCTYLESLSEDVGKRIDAIVNSQQSIEDRINSVDELIVAFKIELINAIIRERENAVLSINNSLDDIIDSENEIKATINSGIEQINAISGKTDEVIGLLTDNSNSLSVASGERDKIREQLQQLGAKLEILDSLDKTIGTVSSDDLSIKETVLEIKKELSLLHEKYSSFEKKMDEQDAQLTIVNNRMEFKIKALTIIGSISAAGIVTLTILQLFL